jgi:hypothetical protein
MTISLAPRSSSSRVAGDALAQLLRALGAVGEVGVVAEIEEVLRGQRDQALVQDGQPADAGIEHRDREAAVRS